MSFFGKIKSAVMGNPVTREYEVGRQVASAGPGLTWKVHQAIKKSTRQEMSVFLFNKQTPEFEKLHKKQREQILEMLRKDPTNLVRLKHPRVLTIDHPLQETNDCLAFATEPVTIGLANILGNYDNLPSPLPLPIKEYEVHPIEIQYGLYNLSEALEFLHCGVRLMHGNITPEVVVVTEGGAWKMMGFNFSCYSQYQSDTQTTFQFQEWDSRRPHNTNPSLDFLAPEYILSKSCNEKSDVFSFGMLCYAVYNGGRPLCSSLNNLLSFKQNVETISRVTEAGLGEVPHGLRTLVKTMLAVEPSVRPDAMEITKHPFFDEVGVATLRYLDTLYEKGDMERSQYFKKNLALVITKLPKRVVHQRVIPALRGEFRNSKMVPFVLPIVLLVAEDCTMQEYSDIIMPVLIPALRIHNPIQVPLILLQRMDLLLKKTAPEDFRQHILPTIIASLETTHTQLQELCISLIPSFATTIDYSSMKHSIVPRLTALMITAESVSLRVKCLVAVGKMLDSLDKLIIHDHILPLLQQIPSREPGVLMAVLGIYHAVMKNKKMGMDKVFMATIVLPFIIPLSVEPTLNIAQFNQFMLVIREMLQCVESEQQAHLEQLSKMEEQTRSTVEFAREVSEAKAMEDTINKFEETFGMGQSHDGHVIQKRGANNPGSPSGNGSLSTAQQMPSHDGYGMFAPSAASSTSSPSSKLPSITPSHPPSSSAPNTRITTGGVGMGVSSMGTGGMGMGVSSMGTGGMGTGVSSMGTGGMGMGVSSMGMKPQTGMGTSTSGSGTETLKPVPFQNTGSSYTPPVASQGGYGNGGMGMGTTSGMGMGGGGMRMWNGSSGTSSQNPRQVNPQPTENIFSGMQLHSSSTTASKGLTAGAISTNQTTGQSHMTTGGPPLVASEMKSASGWSSSIDNGTTAAKPNPAMGWSTNMGGAAQSLDRTSHIVSQNSGMMAPMQPTAAPSANWTGQNPTINQPSVQPNAAQSMDWTTRNQQGSTGMMAPMMAPMQPTAAQSADWTMPVQQNQQPPTMQSTNWMGQNQGAGVPMGASLMMGGGGPLLQPGNHGNQAPPPPLPQQPSVTGNPFADLSFFE